MRSFLLLLTLVLCACPPVRDDVVVGDGTGGPSYLQSAVWFTWGEPTPEYEIGVLQMVGADYGCEDAVAFDIQWRTLDPEVDWITLGQLKGVNHTSWEMAFDSYYAWSVDDGGFELLLGGLLLRDVWRLLTAERLGRRRRRPPGRGARRAGLPRPGGHPGRRPAHDLLPLGHPRNRGGHRAEERGRAAIEDYRFNFNAENCGLLGGQSVPGDEPDGGEDNGGDGNFR